MPTAALVQLALTADPAANLAAGLDALAEAAAAGADLAVFPELSFTPFYPVAPAGPDRLARAEPVPGPTTLRLQEAAARHGLVVVFNLLERAGDVTYDASPVIDADGTLLGVTRMMHITEYAHFHEQSYYAPGDTGARVYATAAGRLGVAICYDRHYPEYLRALALAGADVVAVPQAGARGEWPDGLFEAELQVAAFQHGFYALLVNRVAREGPLVFDGRSFAAGPDGRLLAQAPAEAASVTTVALDYAACAASAARRLFLRDRRPEAYARGAVAPAPAPAPVTLETARAQAAKA